ncbi:MAG TPA: inositol monophosphatase family protein [Gaiellaceae bacterium]
MGPDLRFAHELADAADAITLSRFRASDLRIETKPDLTPVSEADRAAEEAIRSLVARERSGEGVFGEELGDDGAAVRWIVDPIDGTRNYVRGIPVWGTLLALEREGQVDVAVVSAPALGRRWWAERRQGAWAEGKPIRVSVIDRLENATVSTTSTPDMPPGWSDLAARAWASRALGDFWQHCLVAEGALDIATDEQLQLWDYAAVRLIVEEAGGVCSTFEGDAPGPARSFLSATPGLHQAAVAHLTGSDPLMVVAPS